MPKSFTSLSCGKDSSKIVGHMTYSPLNNFHARCASQIIFKILPETAILKI